MNWFGKGLFALAVAAIVSAAIAYMVVGGANVTVTVISINDVSTEALEEIQDIFPVQEGVYCALDGCCKQEGGVSKVDLESGAVICVSGVESETCRCERRDTFRH